MIELLQTFSVNQIIVYTIMLGLAIRGMVSFFQWGVELYKKRFNKDYKEVNKEKKLEEHYMICLKQHKETLEKYSSLENKVDDLTEAFMKKIDVIENQVAQLTRSDMHDIKGWIVEKHHKFMKQGWIDDFTMDILEKRFEDYTREGGNSYISGLMDELRALPHFPPAGTQS